MDSLVFFGSGPVAAVSLERLARNFEIEAVITKPQPPHHKETFPVLMIAERLLLKTFTPTNKDEISALFATKPVQSRVGIVIDYGFIINQDVIDYFPLGILNSHFSLLPKLRGADPITFAILQNETMTGVSLMRIVAALDEGPLLGQKELLLTADETTATLTDNLIELSDELLREKLPLYLKGQLDPQPQDSTIEATYTRKLTKDDGTLDFTKPAVQLEREVRAYLGWPQSRTTVGDKSIIVTKAHVESGAGESGKIWEEGKKFGFYTTHDIFAIDSLKPAGKSEMSAEAFLAGYRSSL